ncbi:hypothetical protein QQP08_026878, partial [Theobroma cacao]
WYQACKYIKAPNQYKLFNIVVCFSLHSWDDQKLALFDLSLLSFFPMRELCWLLGKQKESDVGEVQSEDGFTHAFSRKIRSQIEPRQYHFPKVYANLLSQLTFIFSFACILNFSFHAYDDITISFAWARAINLSLRAALSLKYDKYTFLHPCLPLQQKLCFTVFQVWSQMHSFYLYFLIFNDGPIIITANKGYGTAPSWHT